MIGPVPEYGCATIHVTAGPMSVSIDTHAFRRLQEMLGAAIEKQDSAELASPESFCQPSSHLSIRKVMKIKH
jgi:hypothetical protein